MSTALPAPINTVISIGLLPGNCWAVAAATGAIRLLAMAMILVRVIERILPPLPLSIDHALRPAVARRTTLEPLSFVNYITLRVTAADAALAGAPVEG